MLQWTAAVREKNAFRGRCRITGPDHCAAAKIAALPELAGRFEVRLAQGALPPAMWEGNYLIR
jgi:hypothetical protein